MKRWVLLITSLSFFTQMLKSQTSYVWNGATSTAWNVSTNWTPNGVPGGNVGDNVSIVTGGNACILNANTTINNLTVTSGTLDLGGFNLSANGNGQFTTGTVRNGTLSVNGTATNTAVFSSTTFSANATVSVTTGVVTVNGGIYGGVVALNQTGATQSSGSGGATFNSTLSITNSGSNNFRINGNCTYNGPVFLTNSGTGYLLPELTTGSTYNNTLTLNNSSAQNIRMAYLGINTFNGHIVVNNTGNGSVIFCEQSTATASLTTGKTISVGGSGFSGGALTLSRFTQLGAGTQSLAFSGTATATFNNSTTFNGPLSITSPNIFVSNSTFNGATVLTKTDGTSSNNMSGGNVFNSTLTINYTSSTGTGYWGFANGAADIYNNDVYINNNSLDRIILGFTSTNNQYNGNLIVTQNGSAAGIITTWNSGSSCVMAAGKTVSIGAAGFSVGYLALQGLTQNGSAPINLNLTGTSSLFIGNCSAANFSTINGNLTVSAPDVYIRGGTFNAPVNITKTGGGSDHNNGNLNTFNSTCTINQQSNAGYFMLGYSSADLFNGNITVTATGNGGINLGYNSGTGTPTLSAGNTILVGAAGFSAGILYLGGLTQLGNAAINLTFTGVSTGLYFARGSIIGGDVTANTPEINFSNTTFNGNTSFTKTGAGNDASAGGNVFTGTCTIVHNGTGYLLLGNGSPDTWNNDVTFTNNGTERILPCWTSTGNQFNGNIYVNTNGSAQGIQFCGGNATATATLAANKSIAAGTTGLNAGYLQLKQFTQLGNAAINLTLNPTATYLQYGPSSSFGGNISSSSPGLFFNGATFNGSLVCVKTGTTGDYSQGGNTFNGVTTIVNNGSSYLLLGNASPDTWNNDVTFTNNGSERLLPCWATTGNQFNGNIYVNTSGSAQGIQFCGGNATATATLAANKTIAAGTAGLNAGYLQLRQFTQLGNAAINLTLNPTATYLQFGPSSAFNGNISSSSPGLFFNGATFNGSLTCVKTGTTGDYGNGGNTFNGVTTIVNIGSNLLALGNGSPDTWNNDVTFTDNGSDRIAPCWASVGNQFNGNIALNTSGSAQGIQFCAGNATATAILAANKTIAAGTTGLNAGFLQLKQFTQLGNAAINLTLNPTATYLQYGPSSTFNGNISSSSPGLFFNSTTFNGAINCIKTGTTGDYSPGGNMFNGVTTIVNSGSNFLLLGNASADIWNNDVTFTNNGSERLLPCWATTGNQFNGNVFVNTGGSAQGIQFCGGNATATASLAVNKSIATGTMGLNAGYLQLKQFTQLGNTTVNLVLGATATYLQYGPSSLFNGNVTSSSPGLFFNGCTFNGTANCTKTGSSSDNSSGSNIFNGTAILTNSGSGPLTLGNGNSDQFNTTATFNNTGSSSINVANSSPNNIFGGVTTFNNSPSANSGIFVSSGSTGTVFNDHIIVTSTGGQGVQFCTGNATATSTLVAGKTISIGAGGFSAGTLLLRQFTQAGSTSQNFVLTGTGNLTFGPSSAFGGDITSISPSLFYNGCVFSSTVTAVKSGTTNDASTGNNTFNGDFTVTNTGSGYFLMGNGNPDVWNGTATFNNQSSGQHLYTAYNSSNNIFNGDVFYNNLPLANNLLIYANNSGINTQYNGNVSVVNVNGGGVYFGNGTGSSTLAVSKTVSVGLAGFNYGALTFRNFTQTGVTSQSIVTTGTSNIQFGPAATFDGDVVSTSPGLFFNGCTFNRATNCTKNGSSNDNSSGGNVFAGSAVMNDVGAGYLLFSNGTSDQFQSSATFNNTGTSGIYPAYNATNTVFSGLVTLNNTPASTAGFINFSPYSTTQLKNNIVINQTQGTTYFGNNLTAGNFITQTNGFSVNSGTISGGDMYFYNFHQAGPTLGNTSAIAGSAPAVGNLYINNATFYDNFAASYPNIRNLQASTFNGPANIIKTGGNNQETWFGGNTFNGTTAITNQAATASYYLYIANNAADVYNGDISFVQTSVANIYPNYNTNCSYAGNITVTSPTANVVTFGNAAGGIATIVNTATQTISKGSATTPNPNFTRLIMNKSSGVVNLNTRVNITSYLTMTAGIINTTSVNLVNVNTTATTNIGNASSYINGPMNYDMAANATHILNFPIGKATDWRPGILAVAHNTATSYTYVGEVTNASAAALSWTLPTTVANVSQVHYWDFTRKNTATDVVTPTLGLSGTQTITLYYDVNDVVTDPSNLVICKNTYSASSSWINIGGTGATATTGSVASTSSPSVFTSFSRFTLGNKTLGTNPLPIELLSFTAIPLSNSVKLDWATATEKNNEAYIIERSADGVNFEFVVKVMAKGGGNNMSKQTYTAFDYRPLRGISYYRLKQIDNNGDSKTFKSVAVEFTESASIHVYPNPTSGKLYITAGESYKYANIKVLNTLGAIIKMELPLFSYNGVMDLSDLDAGIYFIVIDNAGSVENVKIGLQK